MRLIGTDVEGGARSVWHADPSVFGGDSTAEPSSRSTILNADSIPVAIRCFWASKSRTSYSMDANKGHVQ